MQFIDLAAQQKRIRSGLEKRLMAVMDHGRYIMGPEIAELEAALASYVGVKHALGCGSGTDALMLALMAKGVGPGDAVFAPPFTFYATTETVSLLGATPVFVDVEYGSFNMDIGLLEKAVAALKAKDPAIHPLPNGYENLTPKAIIGVDLFGLPADYDRINKIAADNGMVVIEDAAQSFGGEYKGRMAGSVADIACTSFFPAKPLGCYGDGGMCFTDDDAVKDAMASLRVHGQGGNKYDNVKVGLNARIDTMQAAVLLEKFSIFPGELDLRDKAATRYGELINSLSSQSALGEGLVAPQVPEGYRSAWAQYSILAKDAETKAAMQANLKEAGIPTAVYYQKPLHLQPVYEHMGYRAGDCPVSEDLSTRIFSLPMHPYIEADAQKKVIRTMLGL